jgi:hypothetical protein
VEIGGFEVNRELDQTALPGNEVDIAMKNVSAELVEHVAQFGELGPIPFAGCVSRVGHEVPPDAPGFCQFA